MTLWRTAITISRDVRSGRQRATTVVEQTLNNIMAHNKNLNAFTAVFSERAYHQAREIDAAYDRQAPLGPLAGVPFAVKNLFDVAGHTTVAGSLINQTTAKATADATLITRLTAAGAILVGALNMGEYAYDFTGENAHYGPSRNPHDITRMTGGSSGGSGAAVAGGLVPLALGSDTNGSIRVPASLCGIFGLKPTFGRLSRAGTFPFCASLDHVGPLARTVADLALAYDILQGPDPLDGACAQRPSEPISSHLKDGLLDLRIAALQGYFTHSASAQALDAFDRIQKSIPHCAEVVLPGSDQARAAAYLITNAESSALHLPRLRTRADDYDPDVRDRLLAGALLPSSWYLTAQRLRRRYQETARAVFHNYDILIAPATPIAAPPLGQRRMLLDGQEVLIRPHLGLYTQPLSFIGLPVAVVPVSNPGGLPIGIQIIGAPWQEQQVLRVAAFLEHEGFTAPLPAPM